MGGVGRGQKGWGGKWKGGEERRKRLGKESLQATQLQGLGRG